MAERTTQAKQVALIKDIRQRLTALEGDMVEAREQLGDVINYIGEIGTERAAQLLGLIKDIYETGLAQRYNTTELQQHRENTLIHYSDKKTNKDYY